MTHASRSYSGVCAIEAERAAAQQSFLLRRLPAPAVAALCLLPMLAGCGQKGPLYLPGDDREVETEITLPDGLDDEAAEREEEEPVENTR